MMGKMRIFKVVALFLVVMCFAVVFRFNGVVVRASLEGYSLSMSKTALNVGEDADLTFTHPNLSTDRYAWIGIYRGNQGAEVGKIMKGSGATNPQDTIRWAYTSTLTNNKLSEVASQNASGGFSAWPMSAGEYDLVIYENNGYKVADMVSFSISDSTLPSPQDPIIEDVIIEAEAVSDRYSFWVVSDTHIGAPKIGNAKTPEEKLDLALKDIKASESSGIFIVGDITNNGTLAQYQTFNNIVEENAENLPAIYPIIGNHDFKDTPIFSDGIGRFTANFPQIPYQSYEVDMGNAFFFVLSGQSFISGGTATVNLYQNQLAWLNSRLQARANSQKPLFVFLHQGLRDTVAGTIPGAAPDGNGGDWSGVAEGAVQLRAILNQHPNVMLFSGHSHWELQHSRTMFVDEGGAIMFNTASVYDLYNHTAQSIDGSQGLRVDVFADHTVVRGRDFKTGSWINSVKYCVPMGNASQATAYQVNVATGNNVATDFLANYVLGDSLPLPAFSGKEFDGWYTDSAFTNRVTAVSFAMLTSGSVTLYPKWASTEEPVQMVTVTFNSNGGSEVNSQTIVKGERATQPATPSKDGYTFAGWYADSQLQSPYSFEEEVTQSITLYAKWQAKSGGCKSATGVPIMLLPFMAFGVVRRRVF